MSHTPEPALEENVSSYSLEKSITPTSEFLGDPSGMASQDRREDPHGAQKKAHTLSLLLGLAHPLLVLALKEEAETGPWQTCLARPQPPLRMLLVLKTPPLLASEGWRGQWPNG